MNLTIGFLLAAGLATTTPAVPLDTTPSSRAVEKTPVFLQTDAQDVVGAAYVATLRDALTRSPTYRPVADPGDARFVVGIVTMDPNEAEPGASAGQSTVASITLRRDNGAALNEFVYSWVLVAKRDKVDSLVAELMAAIDEEIQSLASPAIVFLDPDPNVTR